MSNLPSSPATTGVDTLVPVQYDATLATLIVQGQPFSSGAKSGSAALVIAASNTPNAFSRASIFCAGTGDDATIMAALATLTNGEVILLEGDYFFTGAGVTLKDGINLHGVGFNLNDGNGQPIGGTIVHSTVGVPYTFSANPTNATGLTYPNNSNYTDASWGHGRLGDLAIDTQTYGVKIGAINAPGGFFSVVDNIAVWSATSSWTWGAYFENMNYSRVSNIQIPNSFAAAGSGNGGMFYGASTGSGTGYATGYNDGNSHVYNIYANNSTSPQAHGFVAKVYNGGTMNQTHFEKVVGIQPGSLFSQVGTYTNGSATIGVTDASKFPIDMPVTVSADTFGFIHYQSYFVVSSSATLNAGGPGIQIALSQGGLPILADSSKGAGAANILTYGFPCFEVVGYGEVATQVATFTNLSANISVPTAYQFPIGGAVYVSAVTYGFTPYQPYYVVANSGSAGSGVGNLQLSLTRGGSAIVANNAGGSGAANIKSLNASFQEVELSNLDLEGTAQCMLLLQGVGSPGGADVHICTAFSAQDTNCIASVIARSINAGSLRSTIPLVLDFDNVSANKFYSINIPLPNVSMPVVYHRYDVGGAIRPVGTFLDNKIASGAAQYPATSLGGLWGNVNLNYSQLAFGSQYSIMQAPNPVTGAFLYPFQPVGQTFRVIGSASFTMFEGGTFTNDSGSLATWTLPTITASTFTPGAQQTNLGSPYWLCNNATGQTNLVINTSSGQTIGYGSAITSMTLLPGESLLLIASTDGFALNFWTVEAGPDRLINRSAAVLSANSTLGGNNNTTITNETGLVVTASYPGRYAFEAYLLTSEATLGTGGFKFDFGQGTGTVADIQLAASGFSNAAIGAAAITSATTVTSLATVQTASATPSWVLVVGQVNFSAKGTLGLRWAQNSASANITTLQTGSYLELRRIA